MLNICITADHELFSGENKLSGENVTVKPTKRLLALLEEQGIPVTLFTDVCSLERYRQLLPDDPFPELMEEQLRDAVKRGNDVQLHIHPHWYDSTVKDGKWNIDIRRWRLQDWGFNPDDPENAQSIIRKGKNYLEATLKPLEPGYRCIGFRAGGWCVQPEQQLLRALLNEGIWIDTTVFRGGYNPSPDSGFDFRQAPHLDSWWVSPDTGLMVPLEAGPDRIFEVTIGSGSNLAVNIFARCIYKMDRALTKRKPVISRGSSHDQQPGSERSFGRRLHDWVSQPVQFSYDNACARAMLDIVSHYVRKDRNQSKDSYISAIGHPKTLQEDDYLELERFCIEARRRFDGALRFVTIRDIAEMEIQNRGI